MGKDGGGDGLTLTPDGRGRGREGVVDVTLEGEETQERMESRRSGGRNGRGEGDVVVSGVAIWWMRWTRGRDRGRV